ncbi:TBC1 domain family member 20 [Fasciola gigantica]|uniref:TBC1 domain family member 20 n=1 Tax=Fasciola gigantica TaxID=46835 RepID=A0A504YPR5_FASGI|nr:TBC1 domain family member 20 [Fasciola gigantica]
MDGKEVKKLKKSLVVEGVRNGCNLTWLREFCISTYGLVDDGLRNTVWPVLCGVDNEKVSEYEESTLRSCPSYHQVTLDVNRLDSLMPPDTDDDQKDAIRQDMMRLVVSVLLDNPSVHYYQGFHDICYIFLSVLGPSGARAALNKIVPTRLSLFMEESMCSTVDYMQLIFALLGHLRPKLIEKLELVGLGPDFALSWIVTWFAHVLPETAEVRRLFDLFLATDPMMLIYVSVAVIIRSDEEVHSTTDDFGMLHHTLLRLPKKHPVEELVKFAVKLYIAVPPEQLTELGSQRMTRINANRPIRPIKPTRSKKQINPLYLGALLFASVAYFIYSWRTY